MKNICSKEIEMIRKMKITIVAATMILLVFSACAGGQPGSNIRGSIRAGYWRGKSWMPKTMLMKKVPLRRLRKWRIRSAARSAGYDFYCFADGTQLDGIYYPAAFLDAPLVILMHWAPGDQYDMAEIAYWLQNRGLGGVSDDTSGKPWLDSVLVPRC